MGRQTDWISRWTAIAAIVGWVLASGLDVLSVLLMLQSGDRFALISYHPAEYFLIYAAMRMLVTLAVCLLVVSASRCWSSVSRAVWSALTVCSLATVVVAWWRLVR